ncbi:MAG TPA: hypothetical protein PLN48_15090, partial [Lachnospiraceae bacterium]|nr:hypothetical protein [Lachnospiraceae bacterium]
VKGTSARAPAYRAIRKTCSVACFSVLILDKAFICNKKLMRLDSNQRPLLRLLRSLRALFR